MSNKEDTKQVLNLTDFTLAHRSLTLNGYKSAGQDGNLGHLYTKNGRQFRLVKDSISGGYSFNEVTL